MNCLNFEDFEKVFKYSKRNKAMNLDDLELE